MAEETVAQGLFDPAGLSEDQMSPDNPGDKNQKGGPQDQKDIPVQPGGVSMFGRQDINSPFDKTRYKKLKKIDEKEQSNAHQQRNESLPEIRQKNAVGLHGVKPSRSENIFPKNRISSIPVQVNGKFGKEHKQDSRDRVIMSRT